MPSSRQKRKSFSAARRWIAPAAVVLLAQIALLQAASHFFSEAASHRASQLSNRRLFSQARLEAQRAVDLHPFNGYALLQLGVTDFTAGTTPQLQIQARNSLLKAAPVLPHAPNLLRLLGQTHYHLKDFNAAAATLDQYFRLVPSPKTTAAYLRLVQAMAHFRTANQGAAAVPLTVAASFPEQRLELVVPRLLNALALEQPNSGEAVLRASIFYHPGRTLSNQQLHELFAAASGAGRLNALHQILNAALQAPGAEPRLAKYLAGVYLKTGQTDKAAELVRELRSRQPGDADLPLMLGDIEFTRGNKDAAIEHYREHLRMRPDSPLRGDLQRKAGGLL